MLAEVNKDFGGQGGPGTRPVASSAPLVAGGSEATLDSPARKTPIVLREPGAAPLLRAVYLLPDVNNADVAVLKVLDHVLLSGRTSKLYTTMFESGRAAAPAPIISRTAAGTTSTSRPRPARRCPSWTQR